MSILYHFLLSLILFTLPTYASTPNISLNANKPIEVTADNLTVDDIHHQGHFDGNVTIKQDNFHLFSDKVTIYYDKNASDQKTGKVKKLFASGNVLISSPEEKLKSDTAQYDIATETIFLKGNVLFSRSEAVLSGRSATINLKTRHVDIDSSSEKRIYSIIHLDKVEKN